MKDGYEILQCRSCGILFRADLPDSDSLREIYGAAYFAASAGDTGGQGYADYLGEEANHRANARARLGLLERHLTPGGLLDVGCAAGFFLDEARALGWEGEGVEVSAGMVDHARNHLGLSVHDAPFADVALDAGTFDAVTMWDYIEHSADPAGDLKHASQLLRPGGILALSTGDARSMIARLSGSRWHLLTPRHHNFFFTQESLEKAFASAGMRVELMTYASNLYSVYYLLYKLRTLWDFPGLERIVGRVGRTRLGERAIPINLRDIVTVVGRRL